MSIVFLQVFTFVALLKLLNPFPMAGICSIAKSVPSVNKQTRSFISVSKYSSYTETSTISNMV